MLARRWRSFIEAALHEAGLTEAAWAPLIHLSRLGDGVTQKVLAARIGIDTSTLVRLIDILEERELIQRQIDPEDRRARRIWLTDKGHQLVADIEATLVRAEDAILDGFDDAWLDQMREGITRIGQRLDQLVLAPEAHQRGADKAQ